MVQKYKELEQQIEKGMNFLPPYLILRYREKDTIKP